jgi:hypothetical protein
MDKDAKIVKLEKYGPHSYTIYGIFNFQIEKLVYVNLDFDKVMFEFDLEGYSSEQFDVISFDVILT